MSLIVFKGATLTEEQKDLIKRTVCRNSSDDELAMFFHVCMKMDLDPFMKQIYAIKRAGQMTIQVSIDGYRLIAERTRRYIPGREPSFQYDKDGKKVFSATAYVKKRADDGTWHEISATAFMAEYAPSNLTPFWKTMPHNQLAKCAESLALRRAFPAELSGAYTDEEMEQAPLEDAEPIFEPKKNLEISVTPKKVVETSKEPEKTGDETASEEEFKAYNDLFKRVTPEAKKLASEFLAKKDIVSAALLSSKGINKLMASLAKYETKEPSIEEEVPF